MPKNPTFSGTIFRKTKTWKKMQTNFTLAKKKQDKLLSIKEKKYDQITY